MIRLLFLGKLEDVAGVPELSCKAGPYARVLSQLPADLAWALQGETVRLARNGALVNDPAQLVCQDGDELAFLPPVSGG